ncbi:MAG TPA: peptide ABC transporter substrate-binding protein, partial [Thermomicrobiaceae bacterium]|nr:peptide ABC transporter substrate-binding protein [Thermomicrobiaceae bacterium]
MSNSDMVEPRDPGERALPGGGLSRRGLLQRGVALGLAGSSISALLAACGGSSKTPAESTSAATSAGGSGSAATSAPSAGAASPATSGGGAPTQSSGAVDLASDQTIRVGIGEPSTMDPAVTSGGTELDPIFNMFEGLLGVNQVTGKVEPRLAEKYEANDDASAYTFHLRSGLKWSDGTAYTAKAFEWSWKRVLQPETKSNYIPALYPIKGVVDAVKNGKSIDEIGVKATDDSTLSVTLEAPTPYFPLLATTWTFYPVPQHVIDKAGDKWTEADNVVSNGAYKMTDWKHNQSMMLEQNPNYFDQKPTITKVQYNIYADELAQSIVAFGNNELDVAEVPSSDFDRIKADPKLSPLMFHLTGSSTRFVVCDCTNKPTDNAKFRQALSMALQRSVLSDQIRKGQVVPALTVLPPDIPGYDPDANIGEDVAKAKQLLSDAGITDPASLDLTLVYISTADYKLDAEYVQQAWKNNLGLNIKLEPVESTAYNDWRASREKSPFNLYIGNWGSDWADPANWYNQNFTHASDHYRDHWNNPDFDALVEKARTNTNEDERVTQYKQASKTFAEESPIIPLYHPLNFWVVQPYVKDLAMQPLLETVRARYIK